MEKVQERQQHQPDWLLHIQRGAQLWGLQDVLRRAQIALNIVGMTLRRGHQQRPRVGHDNRIIVHVDDPRLRRNRLRQLMGVGVSRHA